MLRLKNFAFVAAFGLLLSLSSAIMAQTAPVRGVIELKKADGTTVPVVGALVEVYRIDVKAKLPSGKTDKKGGFVFAGLPLGATMTLAISGPGIKADMLSGVRAGVEDLKITVYEGDGVALTEDEVRRAATTAPKPQAQESAEDKKAREELEKQRAEIEAKNAKARNVNEIVKKALQDGGKAYGEKNYDLAIAKFSEGIDADPDFEGSATVLNNNKALAFRMRAFENYKQSTTDAANKRSWLDKAKDDFTASEVASKRTLELVSKITDAVEAKKYEPAKYTALANMVEVHRLMVATNADTSRSAEAVEILDQYLALETDPALKVKNQILVGDALRLSGNSVLAVPIYRRVLEIAPDNVDATGSFGLCLFDVGVSNSDKTQMQEGLNIMQKFTEIAPDTHPLKASVKDAVAYLKDQEKLTPQKTTKTTTTTKKKP